MAAGDGFPPVAFPCPASTSRMQACSAVRVTARVPLATPPARFAPSAGRVTLYHLRPGPDVGRIDRASGRAAWSFWLVRARDADRRRDHRRRCRDSGDLSPVPIRSDSEQAATEALLNVTARVSDIVRSATDPIITIDATQRIVLFNAAAEKVFGWPRDAVIGQPIDKLLPERFAMTTASRSSASAAPARPRRGWAARPC